MGKITTTQWVILYWLSHGGSIETLVANHPEFRELETRRICESAVKDLEATGLLMDGALTDLGRRVGKALERTIETADMAAALAEAEDKGGIKTSR